MNYTLIKLYCRNKNGHSNCWHYWSFPCLFNVFFFSITNPVKRIYRISNDSTLGNLLERFATQFRYYHCEQECRQFYKIYCKIRYQTILTLKKNPLSNPLKSKFASYEDLEKPWIDHTIKVLIKKIQLCLKLRKLGHLNAGE